jgi:membrane-associated phospholipid phosphatase
MALAIVTIIAVSFIGFQFESIRLDFRLFLGNAFKSVLPILVVAGYCHWARHYKLREGTLLVAWACLLINILFFPSYVAARTAEPFHDAFLAHVDQIFGVNVGLLFGWMQSHPHVDEFFIRCYGLLGIMVFAAAVVPAMAGKLKASKEFLITTLVAAIFAAVVFAVFPALGPWTAYGFRPHPNQLWYVQELDSLRQSGPVTVHPESSCGLITFPSFHVALAVLATRALWCFRWVRPVALLTCLLICISTMTTGWHYLSDGIGGVLTVALSVLLVRRVAAAHWFGRYYRK